MTKRVRSPSFCVTGRRATKKPFVLSCHWSTKSFGSLAHYHLQSERPDHTLQSTALVHEAYLRLLGGRPVELQNRAHFIAVASRLMRQILVDYARSRRANKRDGGCKIEFDDMASLPVAGDANLLAFDDALDELSRIDERQGKIVEMKFFGGLSAPEISQVLGISRATVDRDWATARVWLHRQMSRTASYDDRTSRRSLGAG
jgi:RNA polymerase sigma factor (TIGR02999 family)